MTTRGISWWSNNSLYGKAKTRSYRAESIGGEADDRATWLDVVDVVPVVQADEERGQYAVAHVDRRQDDPRGGGVERKSVNLPAGSSKHRQRRK